MAARNAWSLRAEDSRTKEARSSFVFGDQRYAGGRLAFSSHLLAIHALGRVFGQDAVQSSNQAFPPGIPRFANRLDPMRITLVRSLAVSALCIPLVAQVPPAITKVDMTTSPWQPPLETRLHPARRRSRQGPRSWSANGSVACSNASTASQPAGGSDTGRT